MFNKKKIILATGLVMGVASCVSATPIMIRYETQNHSSSSSNQNISKPGSSDNQNISKPGSSDNQNISKPSSSDNQNISKPQATKRDAYSNYKRFMYGVNLKAANLKPETIFNLVKDNESKIVDMINLFGSGDSETPPMFENVEFYFWKLKFGPNTDFSLHVRDIQVSRYVTGEGKIYEATVDIFASPKSGHTWITDGSSSQTSFELVLSNITIQ